VRSVPIARRPRRAAAVLATALLAAAAAAPAGAQAPPAPSPRPDERAAAREFSFAAYRLRVAVLAVRTQIEARAKAELAALADPRCDRAIDAAPETRQLQVVLVAALLVAAPVFDPIRAPLDRYLAELEAVPTADAALRGGRAGWRSEIDLIRRLPSLPDPCGALVAWRRTRYAPSAAPVTVGALANAGLLAADGKLTRAERRMRALGVSAGAARRFTGETLFAGIAEDLDF